MKKVMKYIEVELFDTSEQFDEEKGYILAIVYDLPISLLLTFLIRIF